jgi:hypothetical protein
MAAIGGVCNVKRYLTTININNCFVPVSFCLEKQKLKPMTIGTDILLRQQKLTTTNGGAAYAVLFLKAVILAIPYLQGTNFVLLDLATIIDRTLNAQFTGNFPLASL